MVEGRRHNLDVSAGGRVDLLRVLLGVWAVVVGFVKVVAVEV